MLLQDANPTPSFGGFGFTREGALDRLNLGYLWHAIWVFAYMFFVVGGRLIVSIYRIDGSQRREGPRAAATQTL